MADSATYELDGYSGVRPYYDVRDYDDTREDRDGGRRIGLTVEVYNDGGNIRTSSNSLKTKGQFDQPDNFAANRMSALGKAEVYFQRPYPSLYNAGRVEYGNLFNPYWQVRLIEPDRSERLLAWESRGASGLFSALFP
jgi:hypothetical protein